MTTNQNKLIKYSLILLLLFAILYFGAKENMEFSRILMIVLISGVTIYIVEQWSMPLENMDVIAGNNVLPEWFNEYNPISNNEPDAYQPNYYESGVEFNHDMPNYYLYQPNPNGIIKYEQLDDIINESTYMRLENANDYNMLTQEQMSPDGLHGFDGKDRGYLSWQPIA